MAKENQNKEMYDLEGLFHRPEDVRDSLQKIGIHDIDDVVGCKRAKDEIYDELIYTATHPDQSEYYDIEPGAVLLFGPQGCGKTLLGRAAAVESGALLGEISLGYRGWGCFPRKENLLQGVFKTARRYAENKPVELLIDENNALLDRSFYKERWERTEDLPLFQLFRELIDTSLSNRHGNGVYTVVCTNNPYEDLDKLLINKEVFSSKAFVGPPDEDERKQLFDLYLRKKPVDDEVKTDTLAQLTKVDEKGVYSSADIEHVCYRAAMSAIEREIKSRIQTQLNVEDFYRAISETTPSISNEMMRRYDKWLR